MTDDKIKIEELRILFDIENTRKQNLENKASYFLVIISITITIICTLSSSINLISKFNCCLGYILAIGIITLFTISIGYCLSIFLPRNYFYPFNLNNYEELEKSFKVENNKFKNNLYDQYLTTAYQNYHLNEDIILHLKYSVYSFIGFIILFVFSIVVL